MSQQALSKQVQFIETTITLDELRQIHRGKYTWKDIY